MVLPRYKQAGVDLEKYASLLAAVLGKRTEDSFFSAFYPFQNGYLVASCDGVGTKLLLAKTASDYEKIGVDAVAMVANDLLPANARPLFFLDYIAMEKLSQQRVTALLRGMRRGCQAAGLKLIGGETAEMPGAYPPGGYDVVGFGLGWVNRKLTFMEKQKAGDKLYGLPASGFHANGFSLIRHIMAKSRLSPDLPFAGGKTLKDALLVPTRIYTRPVRLFFEAGVILGCANITGGGLVENVPRMLKEGLAAVIQRTWTLPKLFRFFMEKGKVPEQEAYRVWNMGVGMVVIVQARKEKDFLDLSRKIRQRVFPLGYLERGEKRVQFI